MKEYKAPDHIEINHNPSIFLGGTIDMGDSDDWQKFFTNDFRNANINIYNPRREKWDNNINQAFGNDIFYRQVTWELNALEKADYIIINLLATSKSPISLLELGLHAKSGKLIVCCPEGFYRKGNIDIVCDRYNIPIFQNISEIKTYLIIKLGL